MDIEKIEALSRPIMERVLEAHLSKDYDSFAQCFDSESEVSLPPEEAFNEAVEEAIQPLGKFDSLAYIGSLDKKDSKLILWKAVFQDEELLWHIYLSHQTEQLLAVWFG